tara:strand:- start:4245 stop:4496 length:252 start_codon:yes stop_codon:yes gene_type:complete
MDNANLKDMILNECVAILKREDVKNEFKNLLKPVIKVILDDVYPYIMFSLIFVFISFLLILGIFIILYKYQKKLVKLIKIGNV